MSITLPGLRSRCTIPCLCAALERVGDLRPELHDLVERQRALLQPVREGLALEQLHHQEVRVSLVPDVEERADVGVVERGDRLRLALEPLAPLLVLSEADGEQLDGDAAVEAGVLPPPDLAHSAGADRRRQLVGPEPRSGLDGHESRRVLSRGSDSDLLDRRPVRGLVSCGERRSAIGNAGFDGRAGRGASSHRRQGRDPWPGRSSSMSPTGDLPSRGAAADLPQRLSGRAERRTRSGRA